MDHLDEQHCLAYVEGELTAAEAARFEERVAVNPQLRDMLQQLRTDRVHLRAIEDEAPPPGLIEPVHTRLERDMLLHDTPTRRDADAAAKRWHTYRLATFSGLAAIVLLSTGLILYTLSDSKLSTPVQQRRLALGPAIGDEARNPLLPKRRSGSRATSEQATTPPPATANLKKESKDADAPTSAQANSPKQTPRDEPLGAIANAAVKIEQGRLVLSAEESETLERANESDRLYRLTEGKAAPTPDPADHATGIDERPTDRREALAMAMADKLAGQSELAAGLTSRDLAATDIEPADQSPTAPKTTGTGFPFELRAARKAQNSFADATSKQSQTPAPPPEPADAIAEGFKEAAQFAGGYRQRSDAPAPAKPNAQHPRPADVVVHINSTEPARAIELVSAWANGHNINLALAEQEVADTEAQQKSSGKTDDNTAIQKNKTDNTQAARRISFQAPAIRVLDLVWHINEHAGHVAQPVAIPIPAPAKTDDWQDRLRHFLDDAPEQTLKPQLLQVELVIVQRRPPPVNP